MKRIASLKIEGNPSIYEIRKILRNVSSHFCDARVVTRKKKLHESQVSSYDTRRNQIEILSDTIKRYPDKLIPSLFHEIYHAKNHEKFVRNMMKKDGLKVRKFCNEIGIKPKQLEDSKHIFKIASGLSQASASKLLVFCLEHSASLAKLKENPHKFHEKGHPLYPSEVEANKWAREKILYFQKNKNKLKKLISRKGRFWNKIYGKKDE